MKMICASFRNFERRKTEKMKVLYSWLCELSAVDKPVDEVAEKLTMLGMEVEGIRRFGGRIDGLVSGEVLSRDDHPDSDHLSLCKVNVGEEELDIVCGASNVAVGQIVPVAKVGCVLPGGLKLERAKIRGVVSSGMICSKEELGFEKKSEGIWILEDAYTPGSPSDLFLGKEDAVFDLSLTSNRSDCLSIEGLARELSAVYGVKRADIGVDFRIDEEVPAPVIEMNTSETCIRYSSRIVQGVKIGPSPAWMRDRLEACGIRSINNVVDATNYVLLELGHPLHAFDLAKLDQGKINVRLASPGETLETLDGEKHELTAETMVIADATRPVALAGVMGGANSEVGDSTVALLVESAWFDPVSVRRTARRLGLNTEASYRFARIADWSGTVRALDRAVALILRTAGGAAGVLTDAYPVERLAKRVTLRSEFLRRKLGFDIPMDHCYEILESLDFKVVDRKPESVQVLVPGFRSDVSVEVDLVEEVCRHYGYERIPATVFPVRVNDKLFAAADTLKDEVREVLLGAGLQEVVNFNFVLQEDARVLHYSIEECVTVLNPMSVDQKYLRPSLLPNLLKNIRVNYGHGARDLALFELGNTFSGNASKLQERGMLAVALWGRAEKESWHTPGGRGYDFYDISGILGCLEQGLRVVEPVRIAASEVSYFHPGRSAELSIEGEKAGLIGELHPAVMKELDLPGKIYMMEVSLTAVAGIRRGVGICREVSRFPSMYRDLAFVLDEAVPADGVMRTIQSAGAYLNKCELVSVFHGEQIGSGKKSLAFSFEFSNDERTLSDEEADAVQKSIIEAVEKKHGGVLR